MNSPLTLISKAPLPIPADRRGYWWFSPASTPDAPLSPQNAFLSVGCPQCGASSRLRDPMSVPPRDDGTYGHHIDGDGVVSPSVVCPRLGCGWHVWAKLDGWLPADATVDVIEVQGTPIAIVATVQGLSDQSNLEPANPLHPDNEPSLEPAVPAAAPVLVWHGLIKCTTCQAEERLVVDAGTPFCASNKYHCMACDSLAAFEVLG